MKSIMLVGCLLIASFGSMLSAMEQHTVPLFVKITLHPEDGDKLLIDVITQQTHAKLCARMLAQGVSSSGVCMAIHPDALVVFEQSRSVDALLSRIVYHSK